MKFHLPLLKYNILFQIILSIVGEMVSPAQATLRMPVKTEKYVELHCNMPLEGLLIPLSYNLFIIVLCSVYGFLTRKLPENFNEAWYIFASVFTTIFVWIVLLPTYFTAFYTYHQAALLAFSLFLNASVTLLCLYMPKLYAIYILEAEDIKVAVTTGISTVSAVTNMPPVD